MFAVCVIICSGLHVVGYSLLWYVLLRPGRGRRRNARPAPQPHGKELQLAEVTRHKAAPAPTKGRLSDRRLWGHTLLVAAALLELLLVLAVRQPPLEHHVGGGGQPAVQPAGAGKGGADKVAPRVGK